MDGGRGAGPAGELAAGTASGSGAALEPGVTPGVNGAGRRGNPPATGRGRRGPAAPGDGRGRPRRRGPVRWKVAFFVLSAVGVVAAAAWALLGSRFLVVRSIQVAGTRLVSKSEVVAVARVPIGLPLARLDTAAIARRVERIPQVASAQVTRRWPEGVLIVVRERTPVFAVPAGHRFDLVDASGVLVRQALKPPRGMPLFLPAGPPRANPILRVAPAVPLFTAGGLPPGNAGLRAAAAVLRALPARIARDVTSMTAPGDQAVTLHLAHDITVVWGNSDQAARKARELAILLRTRAHYYDVSAPGSAVTG